jgi:LmbE family N-acetylglucosaminyl deacetylase
MSKKVLFIAVHPDDETLGCGGTILKCKTNGDAIFGLIVTCGYEKDGFSKQLIEERKNEVAEVSSEYGFNKMFELKFPTTLLDTVPIKRIVESIDSILQEIKPDIVYMPNKNDVHTDHGTVFNAVWSCVKSFHNPFTKEVYAYETVSETEFGVPWPSGAGGFIPNTFCDITAYFEKKIKIMEVYQSETKPHPFPRSKKNLEALATFRGATIGVKYAEAFMCLKRVF